jgi:hypothetical protein
VKQHGKKQQAAYTRRMVRDNGVMYCFTQWAKRSHVRRLRGFRCRQYDRPNDRGDRCQVCESLPAQGGRASTPAPRRRHTRTGEQGRCVNRSNFGPAHAGMAHMMNVPWETVIKIYAQTSIGAVSICTAAFCSTAWRRCDECYQYDGYIDRSSKHSCQNLTQFASAAFSNSSARSRAFCVSCAARSNSVRASSSRPSFFNKSPRTLGSRW